MSQKPISPLLRAWYKWKMLRLPWRRQFLVGLDLSGNTYWEFLDRGSRLPSSSPSHTNLSPVRWRRIVRYPHNIHHSAVAVPPAWHQWLRHTRRDPPSLTEQRGEVARQERIRLLAAEADARWEAKPRVMEGGGPSSAEGRAVLGAREPPLETEHALGPGSKIKAAAKKKTDSGEAMETTWTGVTNDATLGDTEAVNQREESWKKGQREAEQHEREEREKEKKRADPRKQHARGGPSETWQPQGWQPGAASKK